MNPALLILIPVIFAIFLTGGFSIKSPTKDGYGQPVTLSGGGIAGIFNSLQINSLVPGTTIQNPTPTVPPGVTVTLTPTNPPGTSPTRGPSLTPVRISPTKAPTPTQGPSLCKGRKIAFDLLFDVSGSIGSLSNEMQKASRRLISLLDDETVVGIQEFRKDPREVVPFNKLRVNRASVISLGGSGGGTRDLTYMKDGFEFARQRISSAQSRFPGYTWYMVVFSDGVPNCDNPNLYPGLSSPCPSDVGDEGPNREQDPTPVANAMKPGITIWSIGFYQYLNNSINVNNNTLLPYGSANDGTRLRRYAVDLMQNRVASSTQFYREYGSGQSLESLYETIGRSACQ